MAIGFLLAALTVTVSPGAECPNGEVLAAQLAALGVGVRESDDVRVRFASEGERLVSEIEVSGTESRRIDHEGPDCASLADATVALLGVLLADRDRTPAQRPASVEQRTPPSEERRLSPFRAEAGIVASTGIVAASAVGPTFGIAWRPLRWGALGLVGEIWPAREHVVANGRVNVGASSLALLGCVGHAWKVGTLEGCLRGHGGLYRLSAKDFPVVRDEHRGLFGVEADLRAALALGEHLGLFARVGVWIPFSQFDVTARGAESGFVTAPVGMKGAMGLELNP